MRGRFALLLIPACCLAALVFANPRFAAAAATPAPTVIDWSKGYAQATDASCGEMTFTHMRAGGSYSLWVRGRQSGTCSFHADGLRFHYPSNYGPTNQGSQTVYSFIRVGRDVVVAWQTGY